MLICHRYCIQVLDLTLQNIMQNSRLFGGKVFLFAGDFRIILPVVPSVFQGQIFNARVKPSIFYQSFYILRLSDIMRLRSLFQNVSSLEDAVQFQRFLLKIEEEMVPADDISCIYIPQYIQRVSACEDLYYFTYENLEQNISDKKWFKNQSNNHEKEHLSSDHQQNSIYKVYEGTKSFSKCR